MPKINTLPKFRKVLIKKRQPKEWLLPASLKKALQEHELWPNLRAQ